MKADRLKIVNDVYMFGSYNSLSLSSMSARKELDETLDKFTRTANTSQSTQVLNHIHSIARPILNSSQ
jgi:hypothetical protein